MKPILLAAIAALALAACAPKPAPGADQSAQGGATNNAGCTTTRDANNNVTTQCP
jgi:hypothetical protein